MGSIFMALKQMFKQIKYKLDKEGGRVLPVWPYFCHQTIAEIIIEKPDDPATFPKL